jgi:hypothetical protein
MAERRVRGEERDALIRSQLVPLAPGERPRIVLLCVAVCVAITVGNLVLWAAGWKVRGQDYNAAAAIVPALLFAWLGYGLWRTRLLAIAAMQVALAVTALFASGALLVSSDFRSAALSLTIVVICAALFWPLIRLNARAGLRDRVEDRDTVGDQHG